MPCCDLTACALPQEASPAAGSQDPCGPSGPGYVAPSEAARLARLERLVEQQQGEVEQQQQQQQEASQDEVGPLVSQYRLQREQEQRAALLRLGTQASQGL